MIGKSYIFHLFLFLLILPDSIYSQDNICLIPQVESMVRKKGTLSIERLESIHFPDEWKNTGNLLVSDLKELANLSVMVNASNPSIHVKKVKMQEPEMYMLEITKQGIIIEAGDQTGMIHAIPGIGVHGGRQHLFFFQDSGDLAGAVAAGAHGEYPADDGRCFIIYRQLLCFRILDVAHKALWSPAVLHAPPWLSAPPGSSGWYLE